MLMIRMSFGRINTPPSRYSSCYRTTTTHTSSLEISKYVLVGVEYMYIRIYNILKIYSVLVVNVHYSVTLFIHIAIRC